MVNFNCIYLNVYFRGYKKVNSIKEAFDFMKEQGASVVISHHILDGKHQQYEEWLSEIAPICKSYPGHIDWQIIRPIPNLTFIYTIVIRFDTINNLKIGWHLKLVSD